MSKFTFGSGKAKGPCFVERSFYLENREAIKVCKTEVQITQMTLLYAYLTSGELPEEQSEVVKTICLAAN